jgi:hypothetical protein
VLGLPCPNLTKLLTILFEVCRREIVHLGSFKSASTCIRVSKTKESAKLRGCERAIDMLRAPGLWGLILARTRPPSYSLCLARRCDLRNIAYSHTSSRSQSSRAAVALRGAFVRDFESYSGKNEVTGTPK